MIRLLRARQHRVDVERELAAFDQYEEPTKPHVSDVEVAAAFGWMQGRALVALVANADDGNLSLHEFAEGEPPETWLERFTAVA